MDITTRVEVTPYERFRVKVKIPPPGTNACWEWIGGTTSGYGRFWLKGRFIPAHRFLASIPPDMLACHKCDNRRCVRPSHIFAGTPLDNTRDCIAKGRFRPHNGVEAAAKVRRVLTDQEVIEIRRLKNCGQLRNGDQRRLASKYGVGPHTISWAINRKTYRHVTWA